MMKTRTFQWFSVAIIAIIAAVRIYRHENWGWLLGVGIALGSLVGYVLGRTVGLPGMEIEEWLQPVGVLSLAVEVVFVLLVAAKKPWVGFQLRAQ